MHYGNVIHQRCQLCIFKHIHLQAAGWNVCTNQQFGEYIRIQTCTGMIYFLLHITVDPSGGIVIEG